MYKCTECGSLYENLPEFCDNCGNDYFEETGVQPAAPEEQYRAPEPPKTRQPSRAELEEIEEEKKNKKISSAIIGTAVFIALLIIALPPYPDFKAEKAPASAPARPSSSLAPVRHSRSARSRQSITRRMLFHPSIHRSAAPISLAGRSCRSRMPYFLSCLAASFLIFSVL